MSTVSMGTKPGLRAEALSLWEQPEHVRLQERGPLCGRRGLWVLPSVHPFRRGVLETRQDAEHPLNSRAELLAAPLG